MYDLLTASKAWRSYGKVSICQCKTSLPAGKKCFYLSDFGASLKLLFSLFILFSFELFAATSPRLIPKVIYGIDDRLDVYQSSDSLLKELSRSTAAQIKRDVVSLYYDDYVLNGDLFGAQGMCTTERFLDQLAVAECSGFLIAPDLLVTAGHCARNMSACDLNYWIFDYANVTGVVKDFKFNDDQIFYCTQILAFAKDINTLNDFAVLKLNRPVPGRKFLKVRTTGKIANDAKLAVLGYPSGLPLKIASNAVIRDNTNSVFFRINSDTFGGNSGSAVVDSKNGIVEGILVRGDTDFEKVENRRCYTSVVRPEDGGRGDDATRITNLPLKDLLFYLPK